MTDCWCGHSYRSHVMYEGKQSSCGEQCPCDGFMEKDKSSKLYLKSKAVIRRHSSGYGWNMYFRNRIEQYLTYERAVEVGIQEVRKFYKLTDAGYKE